MMWISVSGYKAQFYFRTTIKIPNSEIEKNNAAPKNTTFLVSINNKYSNSNQ